MDSIMGLMGGDETGSNLGVLSMAVAGAFVAATALVMRRRKQKQDLEEEKNRQSKGKLGSALEELTQKERDRRKCLEEEVRMHTSPSSSCLNLNSKFMSLHHPFATVYPDNLSSSSS